jgi:hypothetical protein
MQSCCSKPDHWLLGNLGTGDGLESGALYRCESKFASSEMNVQRPVNGLPNKRSQTVRVLEWNKPTMQDAGVRGRVVK